MWLRLMECGAAGVARGPRNACAWLVIVTEPSLDCGSELSKGFSAVMRRTLLAHILPSDDVAFTEGEWFRALISLRKPLPYYKDNESVRGG